MITIGEMEKKKKERKTAFIQGLLELNLLDSGLEWLTDSVTQKHF